jgi:hypothetical protein
MRLQEELRGSTGSASQWLEGCWPYGPPAPRKHLTEFRLPRRFHLVPVPVTVVDAAGAFVNGPASDVFVLTEDGAADTLVQREDAPVSMGINWTLAGA